MLINILTHYHSHSVNQFPNSNSVEYTINGNIKRKQITTIKTAVKQNQTKVEQYLEKITHIHTGESEASWATFFQMFIVLIQFI